MMLILLAFLAFNTTANAQRIVNVAPGYGTLNDAVASDPNPDEAIFVLQRGGLYELTDNFAYDGEMLHFRGEEGDGPRAMLQPVVDITGSSAHHIQIRSGLTLENVVMMGWDDLGVKVHRHIRLQKENVRMVINNVFFETGGQTIIRFDSPGISAFVTNVVARNVGITDSNGNGRFLDTRSNPADTLYFANNTFYQFVAELVRMAGSFANYFHWDHNTVYNSHSVFGLSRALEARITNSLFVNHNARTGSRGSIRTVIGIDSLVTFEGFTDDDRSITLHNLNFVQETQLRVALIDEAFGADTLLTGWTPYRTYYWEQGIVTDSFRVGEPLHPRFMSFIEAGIADTSNIFTEELDFSNPPSDMIEYGIYDAGGGTTDFPRWRVFEDPAAHDDPFVLGDLPENAFSFVYPTTARSYTAGRQGFPLGDLNAFPEVYEQWIFTDARDALVELPDRLQLRGNYPNPFNPTTTIMFDLPHQAEVTIAVYDILGRQVMALPSMMLSAGSGQQVQLDASTLASGIYFYQVMARSAQGAQAQTGRMVLMK